MLPPKEGIGFAEALPISPPQGGLTPGQVSLVLFSSDGLTGRASKYNNSNV